MRNFNKNIEIFFKKLIIIGMVDFDEERDMEEEMQTYEN